MINSTINLLSTGLRNSYNSFYLIPSDIILFLTYRCTSRCKTCNIWKRPSAGMNELDWDGWQPILEKIAANGIKSIELFGGDALLRKNLFLNMLRFCEANKIDTYFPTNSNLLDETTIVDMLEAGLGTIYFSLDEIPSMDSTVRGVKDHFRKVKDAITLTIKHRAAANKPTIVCITTVSKHNYKYLKGFVEFAENIGVDELMLRGLSDFPMSAINKSKIQGIYPEPYFMSTEDGSSYLTPAEAKDLLSLLTEIKKRPRKQGSVYVDMKNMEILSADYIVTWRYPKIKCVFCTTKAILTPAADVLPCPYYNNYVLGNLQQQDITEIWGNARHRYFCAKQKNDRLELCNFCSNKFYNKAFWASLQEVAGKAKEKIVG